MPGRAVPAKRPVPPTDLRRGRAAVVGPGSPGTPAPHAGVWRVTEASTEAYDARRNGEGVTHAAPGHATRLQGRGPRPDQEEDAEVEAVPEEHHPGVHQEVHQVAAELAGQGLRPAG